MYQATVPVFIKMLTNLKTILEKGEAFAETNNFNPEKLLTARLAPDMFDLIKQRQIASDNAKGISARRAGMEPPKMEDTEKNFSELSSRIEKTITFLETLKPEQFVGSESKQIPFPYIEGKYLLGNDAVFTSYLPNFFFHVTTAYDILRNQGVELGKADYIGSLPLKDFSTT